MCKTVLFLNFILFYALVSRFLLKYLRSSFRSENVRGGRGALPKIPAGYISGQKVKIGGKLVLSG